MLLTEDTKQLIVILLLGVPTAFAILYVCYLLIFKKDAIAEAQIKREAIEIEKAVPYKSIETAKNEILKDNLKPILMYGVYFMVTVPLLIYRYGGITYGPNQPYTVFLFAIGVPFIICFIHIIMKIEKQRYRLQATSASPKETSEVVPKIWTIV